MRRIIILMAIFIAGCGAMEQRQAVRHAENYVADKKPMAERGEILWSDYYKGLYNFFIAADAPGAVLAQVNEMGRVAENYEAGRISKSDFDYERRVAEVRTRGAAQARAYEQAQLGAAQTLATAQLLQATAPRPAYVAPAAAPAGFGLVGFIKSQSTNGMLRYCTYSNGVVKTVNSIDLCPMDTQ